MGATYTYCTGKADVFKVIYNCVACLNILDLLANSLREYIVSDTTLLQENYEKIHINAPVGPPLRSVHLYLVISYCRIKSIGLKYTTCTLLQGFNLVVHRCVTTTLSCHVIFGSLYMFTFCFHFRNFQQDCHHG